MKSLIHVFIASIIVFVCGGFVVAQTPQQESEKTKIKSSSQVSVKYDKKKDLTTVRLKAFRISRLILEKEATTNVPLHQTDLEVSYTFQGQQSTKPVESVFFRFQVSSSNYTFLRPQTVMAVLDNDSSGKGRAFALGNAEYKSYPPKFNSVYEESFVVDAPSDALAKMAKANSLEIYLGPVGYSITKEQLDAIRELAGFLPNAGSSVKSN